MKPRLASAVVALALLSGCENGSRSARPSPEPTSSQSFSPADDHCLGTPHFKPILVPNGWDTRLQPGDGGGGAGFPGLLGHYGGKGLAGTRTGATLGFITVTVGRAPFAQSNPIQIRVLGSAGTVGQIHEGFSVEFSFEGCDYALLGYGLERTELAAFARRLEPTSREGRGIPPEAFAVWPEDTKRLAQRSCDRVSEDQEWRRRPYTTALEFASEVLVWPNAQVTVTRETYVLAKVRKEPTTKEGLRDNVWLSLEKIRDRGPLARPCWSVKSVSRPADRRPTGASVSVQGRVAMVACATFRAASTEIMLGYRGRELSKTSRDGLATFHLNFEPNTSGHFLVLLKDEAGEVFSACGAAVPAGNFAAG